MYVHVHSTIMYEYTVRVRVWIHTCALYLRVRAYTEDYYSNRVIDRRTRGQLATETQSTSRHSYRQRRLTSPEETWWATRDA